MASLLLLPKLLFSAKALHWPPKWCELFFSCYTWTKSDTRLKFAKLSFNFSIEDLAARATAASSTFFSPTCHPMTTLIGSLVTRLLWAGKMWGFGDRENKQGGVRDGERCVNGQVALSLPALFWDNRKNKERGVTDNWTQTATSGINGLVLGHALIQSRGGRGAGCLIMAFFPQFVA